MFFLDFQNDFEIQMHHGNDNQSNQEGNHFEFVDNLV
jgi:hypothetical protein